MAGNLVIIANENAGGGRATAQVAALRAELSPDERLVVTSDRASLSAAAREVAASGVQRVGIVGGDGTITTTLTALRDAAPTGCLPPEVLLLGGGSMNTVARGLGLASGSARDRLRRARGLRAGAGRVTHPMVVNGQVGFLLSTGLMHGFLSEYYAAGVRGGAAQAAALLARGVVSALCRGPLARRLAARYRAVLELDGEVLPERDYLFVGAGAVPPVGIGFRPYARALPGTQGFHVIAHFGTVPTLALRLPAFACGRGDMVGQTVDRLVRRLCIRSSTGEALPFALDGEMHPGAPCLHVELGTALRIV